MKRMIKTLLPCVLALAMLMTFYPAVFAAETSQMTEADSGEITLRATDVDLTQSSTEQTATIYFYVDKNVQISALNVVFTASNATNIQLETAVPANELAATTAATAGGVTTSDMSGKYVSYNSDVDGYVLFSLPITVSANSVGQFQVIFTVNNIADADNGDGYTVASNSVTATITVTVPEEDGGEDEAVTDYVVTLSGATTNGNPVRVDETLKVNIGANKDFAATEMTITYPSDLVSFDKDNSTLGTATITDDEAGTLTLADYGADKTAASDNYVLAFTANVAGTAAFAITEAGFGTAADAINKDLTAVDDANLSNVSITIKKVPAIVTFTDDLFYSELTKVEIGETFTFYPETTTGAYYKYDLPKATMVGSDTVTVVETGDGGWKIENVTGDITIAAADRDPKSFGDVTYDGTGVDKITDQTVTAVYLSDIKFTIPVDVEASTENGYTYTVSAKIDGKTYTLAAPETTEATRTYTIPGADVKGAVVITVTETVIDPNKVTVTIAGATTDGKLGDNEAGAPIQIDKNGSVTLTVDLETGLNKGYDFTVNDGTTDLVLDENGQVTISNINADTTITITKTLNVDDAKNVVEVEGQEKNYLNIGEDETAKQMWLIQLPNHVGNTSTATYTYDGKDMFWSADHNNFVIVVISDEKPAITADMFGLKTVEKTPEIAADNWDVNKSGSVDANDAQMIWNMYESYYTEINESADGATTEKFLLADANHDGILDTNDAVVIINKILDINN